MENHLISIAATIITGLLSFLGGRKMARAKVQASELENVDKALGIYRKLVEDLTKEINGLRNELAAVYAQNKILIADNEELRTKLASLSRRLEEINP